MALLDDLKTRIEGLSTGYTVDLGYLSDDTDKRIVIYEYQGLRADHGLGMPGLQFEYPGVQVVSRGVPTDYAGPRAALNLVFLDFPKMQAATVGGSVIKFVRANQSPFFLKRDEKQRVLFAVNFIIQKNA